MIDKYPHPCSTCLLYMSCTNSHGCDILRSLKDDTEFMQRLKEYVSFRRCVICCKPMVIKQNTTIILTCNDCNITYAYTRGNKYIVGIKNIYINQLEV